MSQKSSVMQLPQFVPKALTSDKIWSRIKIQTPEAGRTQGMIRNPDRYPLFNWGIGPGLRQHIGGCESRMAVMSAAWFVEFRHRLPWLLHVD